jgi:hypothetical protein
LIEEAQSRSIPMQRGDEDGALDRKLDCALLQQADQCAGDAEPPADSAKQQWPPIRLVATDGPPSASSSSALISST